MFLRSLVVLTLVACGPAELDAPADLACADALQQEDLRFDDAFDGECYGSLDDTARYACNATGCAQACGPNAVCVNWSPNGNGGCNFYCVLTLAPTPTW